jgi:hypothetical protein
VSGGLDRLRGRLDDLRTIAAMPRIDLVASRGSPEEEAELEYLRSRHPRYKVVGRKVVGAALLPLDGFDDAEGYLAELRYARRRVRRADRLGYSFAPFEPDARRAELLAIHTSMPERQGRAIDPSYLDPEATYPHGAAFDYVGIVRADVLLAYSQLLYAGDMAAMARVMGHGEHLADGIMFQLVAGIVGHLKQARPQTRYLFYDMFFGAAPGLREFKTRAGFRPHYVRWKRASE